VNLPARRPEPREGPKQHAARSQEDHAERDQEKEDLPAQRVAPPKHQRPEIGHRVETTSSWAAARPRPPTREVDDDEANALTTIATRMRLTALARLQMLDAAGSGRQRACPAALT
jgi:hypothetical protein